MISIDGSAGEGGGQILRSALALSMVTGQPFRIERIRANRDKPGLMRQHLTSVRAACAVCAGEAEGAELGSSVLEFTPGAVRGGEYAFEIGTAGSTTLVLQTVLPALITASDPSTVVLSGGTHNPHAPSVDFLRTSFVPLVERMGPRVGIELIRHGFYPAGGGKIRAEITPAEVLTSFEILETAPIVSRRAAAATAGLPPSIAKRELAVVAERLGIAEEYLTTERIDDAQGPGNVLSIEVERSDVTEVFTGFGERGVSAERVASTAAKAAQRYIIAGVPVWRYLADQLMLPLAMARGGAFRTGPLSRHAVTNAGVIERFLDVRVHVVSGKDDACCVRILS